MLAALAGTQLLQPRELQQVSRQERAQYKRERWRRRRDVLCRDVQFGRRLPAERLRAASMTLRGIAKALGVSPATMLRDLRRDA